MTQAHVFKGPAEVDMFRAIAIKVALSSYVQFKMRMNKQLTPTAMLTIASEYTGKTYKRGQHEQALKDMVEWIAAAKAARDAVKTAAE